MQNILCNLTLDTCLTNYRSQKGKGYLTNLLQKFTNLFFKKSEAVYRDVR